MIRLKIKSPAGGSGLGGKVREEGGPSCASVGGEKAALLGCTNTAGNRSTLDDSVCLWKGAEGKGEEINRGISHPVER